MTTVQITLPDQLVQEAQRAGLLSPRAIERWLREQLKARHVDELFAAMDRMAAVDEPTVMSPEEVSEEIRVMRAERRAGR
jgi:Arc/MetJ family transcription regulator